MEPRLSTTPFGRRLLTLAHVAANAKAKASANSGPVHKWQLFRDVCAAKTLLDVNERSLAVLDALLSFHPETALTGEGLIVFPSNRQLCLRAHGMAEATLRRHLAALATAGLIVRRDSPNGKRYARKSGAGEIEKAFGFDLAPLVARAEEIAGMAARVRDEELAMRQVRERITLCRRDIVKMIALGFDEDGQGDWPRYHGIFRGIIARLPRRAARTEFEGIADELTLLAEEIENRLEMLVNFEKMDANPDQSERHKQNSNTYTSIDFEPRQPNDEAAVSKLTIDVPSRPQAFPLGMVLEACPDLADYARTGIGNWRDFLATVVAVRPMLGISSSAWEDASDAMGDSQAAIVVACILQRSSAIGSAGGYLRDLTGRSRAGQFSVGPMLMALLSAKRKQQRLKA